MFNEVKTKFSLNVNGELESACIIKKAKVYENFQENISKMFDKLKVFWEEMTSEQAKKTAL